ncbi:MAG: 30S ribosomal protein S17 [Candidatus Yanofskybacteria bacterium]|nr:30S ribosomal protein S17 [Candidatus Yanofskybacteria bacterium]
MDKISKKIKTLRGEVVSDKMTKTVVVSVVRLKKHPKYKKYYKVTNRFKAHDEKGEYHVGDKVMIQETRPMSKEKCWVVVGKI